MKDLKLSKRNLYYIPKKLFYTDVNAMEEYLTMFSDIRYFEITDDSYYQKRTPEKGSGSTKNIPKQELYDLFIEQEYSIPAIAKLYGMSRMCIYKKLLAYGLLDMKKQIMQEDKNSLEMLTKTNEKKTKLLSKA